MNELRWLVIVLMAFSTDAAFSAAKLTLGVSHVKEESEAGNTDSSATVNIFDIGLGGDVSTQSAFVGFKYFSYSYDANGSDVEITSAGLSAGYFDKSGFSIVGTWLVNPEKKVEGGQNDVVYKADTGLQIKGLMIDLAYYFKAGSFYVGPKFSLADFNYDTVDLGDGEGAQDLDDDTSDTLTYPYVSFLFEL
jgi:ABC-type proline/glycine betaine transport system substrate-binding protein